jgi:hypothetical protein
MLDGGGVISVEVQRIISNFYRENQSFLARTNRNQTFKKTLLPQAEAKGSTINMLALFNFSSMYHCQLLTTELFVTRQLSQKEMIKTEIAVSVESKAF